MRSQAWAGVVFVALLAGSRVCGQEPRWYDPSQCGQGSFLQRFHPAGGWDPYGGGLLHWWDPHCFPRCGGPDDYCRKKMPQVCWPPYPPYFQWGPPAAAATPPGPGACTKEPPCLR
jgi:hypothetical protein